jgi:hypothetical protein
VVLFLLLLNPSSVFAINGTFCLRKNTDTGVIEYDTKNGKGCTLLMNLDRTPNIVVNGIEENITGTPCTLTENDSIQNAENLIGIIIKNKNTYRVRCNTNYYGDVVLECSDGVIKNIGFNSKCTFNCKISDIKNLPSIEHINWNDYNINSEEYVGGGTEITVNSCVGKDTYMLNPTDTTLSTKTITCTDNVGWIDNNQDVMCKENMLKIIYKCSNSNVSLSRYFRIGSTFVCIYYGWGNFKGENAFYGADPCLNIIKQCIIDNIVVVSKDSLEEYPVQRPNP